ncbi:hypothetical protein CYMTET_46966 [Cymbomonas tetramitiformis]|uniref:NADH:ubiquinone oxidoreductase intermediate-associated protein 30 domain-containing protein n=1 Tax=Cymbomonas tetramitiformis TaxID=36881 RepID=A0AAE0BV85_9CHLO|nr:hypothetical protein CYMTET_46966 [Cymbomonas tetramitiformis]
MARSHDWRLALHMRTHGWMWAGVGNTSVASRTVQPKLAFRLWILLLVGAQLPNIGNGQEGALALDGGAGGWSSAWYYQADTVMGGRSSGSFTILEDDCPEPMPDSWEGSEEACCPLHFTGELSVVGGGFTSLRRGVQPTLDLSAYSGIQVRFDALGLGEEPLAYHLRVVSASDSPYWWAVTRGHAFVASERCVDTAGDDIRDVKTCTVYLPFADFTAHSRSGQSEVSTPMSLTDVNGFSIYLLFQEGAFDLKLRSLDAVTTPSTPTPPALAPGAELSEAQAALRRAISSGVPLYNKGYHDLCAVLYQSASEAVVTCLPTSEAASGLSIALEEAASMTWTNKAWHLRYAMNEALLLDPAIPAPTSAPSHYPTPNPQAAPPPSATLAPSSSLSRTPTGEPISSDPTSSSSPSPVISSAPSLPPHVATSSPSSPQPTLASSNQQDQNHTSLLLADMFLCSSAQPEGGSLHDHRTLHVPLRMVEAADVEAMRRWAAALCCVYTHVQVKEGTVADLVTYDGEVRSYNVDGDLPLQFTELAEVVMADICGMAMGSWDCASQSVCVDMQLSQVSASTPSPGLPKSVSPTLGSSETFNGTRDSGYKFSENDFDEDPADQGLTSDSENYEQTGKDQTSTGTMVSLTWHVHSSMAVLFSGLMMACG